MSLLEIITYVGSALTGAFAKEIYKAVGGYITARRQSDASITIVDKQIEADKEKELRQQVNDLLAEWQAAFVDAKERESQIKILNYILRDCRLKIESLTGSLDKLKAELISKDVTIDKLEGIIIEFNIEATKLKGMEIDDEEVVKDG
jgi:hypothetical protein